MCFLPLFLVLLFLQLSHLLAQTTCPRGTFQSQPSLQCISCPPGTFQATLNATFCSQCPPGRFQPFSAAQTSEACRPCQPGTFSPSGSEACFSCPLGLSSGPASSTCVSCQPGTFLSRTNATLFQSPCRPCNGGFTEMPNQNTCTACPPGFAAPAAASSAEQCTIACPPGTQSGAEGCEKCPAGTFSADGKQCRLCAAGSVSNSAGADSCTPCHAGERAIFISESSASSRCESCPPGSISFTPGALICRQRGNPCPRGYLQLSSGDCIRCPFDYYYEPASEQCIPCDDGMGSADGVHLSCASCSHIVRAGIKDSRCFKAASGIVVAGDNDAVCPPGTKGDDGLGVCIACERGTFSAAGNGTECARCPAGSVQPSIMATNCIPCADGTVPDEELLQCVVPQTNCPVGMELITSPDAPEGSDNGSRLQCRSPDCETPPSSASSAASRACGSCKPSEYMNADMSCSLCAPNSVSDGKFCVECPSGLVRDVDTCACRGIFAQNKGLFDGVCQKCTPGSYGLSVNMLGSNSCVQCPAGTYRDLSNDDSVASCDPSSIESCPDPVPCKRCPPNTITREPGATECLPCPNGTFSYGIGETECLREGAASEPVSVNNALGFVSDEDAEETEGRPDLILDEVDDMTTTADPEESQIPEMGLQSTESPMFSSEPVLETSEES